MSRQATDKRLAESTTALAVDNCALRTEIERLRFKLYYYAPFKGTSHTTACTIWREDGQGHADGFDGDMGPCNCGALANYYENRALKAEEEIQKLRAAAKELLEWVPVCSSGSSGHIRTENLKAAIQAYAASAPEQTPERELKYAAKSALDWMLGAMGMGELGPWVDPVTIDMLRVAIERSAVRPKLPTPPKDFKFTEPFRAAASSQSAPTDANPNPPSGWSITQQGQAGTVTGVAQSAASSEPQPPSQEWRKLPVGAWFFDDHPECVNRYSVMERTSGGCVSICSTSWHHEKAKRDMQEIARRHNAGADSATGSLILNKTYPLHESTCKCSTCVSEAGSLPGESRPDSDLNECLDDIVKTIISDVQSGKQPEFLANRVRGRIVIAIGLDRKFYRAALSSVGEKEATKEASDYEHCSNSGHTEGE